jgi:molybdenum-dependent DNA-binding transcriptional regulator ModE
VRSRHTRVSGVGSVQAFVSGLTSVRGKPVAVTATVGRGHDRTKLTPVARQAIRLYRKFDEIQARASKYFGFPGRAARGAHLHL